MAIIRALLRLTPEEHARVRQAAAEAGMSGHATLRAYLAPLLHGEPTPAERIRRWSLRLALDSLEDQRQYLTRTLNKLDERRHNAAPGSLARQWLDEERDSVEARLTHVHHQIATLQDARP